MNKAFQNNYHNVVTLKFPNGNYMTTMWGTESHSDNFSGHYDCTFLDSDKVQVIIGCSYKLRFELGHKFEKNNLLSWIYVTMPEWLSIVSSVANEPIEDKEKYSDAHFIADTLGKFVEPKEDSNE